MTTESRNDRYNGDSIMKHPNTTHCSDRCEALDRCRGKKLAKKRLREKRERLSGELIPTKKEMRAIELGLLEERMRREERRAQAARDGSEFMRRLRQGEWVNDRVYGGLIRRGI